VDDSFPPPEIACGQHLGARQLEIDHAGVGVLEVAGRVHGQAVRMSGAGSYAARGLQSEVAVIHMTGSAHAVVRTTDSLEAEVRGAGVVEYCGEPRVRQRIYGMGGVPQIGSEHVWPEALLSGSPFGCSCHDLGVDGILPWGGWWEVGAVRHGDGPFVASGGAEHH
jgi:hypothetical protein